MNSRILRGLIAILVLPFPVLASLGDDVSTVQADQVKMQGSLRKTSTNSYSVHEIQTPTGIAVREYVSPAGKVFAVAWQGPFHPDLRQLLGVYFDQYTQAVQAQQTQRHGRGPLLIQEPGLVVEVTGHLRAFHGVAYVPQMLPAGVHSEELR
ncbi:MAG TPA: DUF2844 domain-containing protein [Candidatus Acidoferrum sp.]|nr:DUF2844 domain-containing protein [Candidatus Acidoferrum sp.]